MRILDGSDRSQPEDSIRLIDTRAVSAVVAGGMIAEIPELGTLDRRKIAARSGRNPREV